MPRNSGRMATAQRPTSVPDDRLIDHRLEMRAEVGVAAHQLRAVDGDEVLLGIDEQVRGRGAGPSKSTHRPDVAVLGGVHQNGHAETVAGDGTDTARRKRGWREVG